MTGGTESDPSSMKLLPNNFCCIRNINHKETTKQDGENTLDRALCPQYWIGRVVKRVDETSVRFNWFVEHPFKSNVFFRTSYYFVEKESAVSLFRSGLEWNEEVQGYKLVKDIGPCLQASQGGQGPDSDCVKECIESLRSELDVNKEETTTTNKVEATSTDKAEAEQVVETAESSAIEKNSANSSPTSSATIDSFTRPIEEAKENAGVPAVEQVETTTAASSAEKPPVDVPASKDSTEEKKSEPTEQSSVAPLSVAEAQPNTPAQMVEEKEASVPAEEAKSISAQPAVKEDVPTPTVANEKDEVVKPMGGSETEVKQTIVETPTDATKAKADTVAVESSKPKEESVQEDQKSPVAAEAEAMMALSAETSGKTSPPESKVKPETDSPNVEDVKPETNKTEDVKPETGKTETAKPGAESDTVMPDAVKTDVAKAELNVEKTSETASSTAKKEEDMSDIATEPPPPPPPPPSSDSPESKKSESESPIPSDDSSEGFSRIGEQYQAEVVDFVKPVQDPKELIKGQTIITEFDKDASGQPIFGSVLPKERYIIAGTTPTWNQVEKSAFEKAIYKHSTHFHKVAKEVKEIIKAEAATKTTAHCVQYFYDHFHKSRNFTSWKKHNDAALAQAERDLRAQELAERREKRKKRRHVAEAKPTSRRSRATSTASTSSGKRERAAKQTTAVKQTRARKQMSLLGNARKLKSLARRDKPWCRPECEFMPARSSQIPFDSPSDEENEHHCICNGSSDGTMVLCSECDVWFHAACVGLRKDMTSEYSIFRCGKCAKYSRKGCRGPELEKPASWSIKEHRGESPYISIIALKSLKVQGPVCTDVSKDLEVRFEESDYDKTKTIVQTASTDDGALPEENVQLGEGDYARLKAVPSKRNYTLLLGSRSVPVWDSEKHQLIAGLMAPSVRELEDFLQKNPMFKPWHGAIRKNVAAMSKQAAVQVKGEKKESALKRMKEFITSLPVEGFEYAKGEVKPKESKTNSDVSTTSLKRSHSNGRKQDKTLESKLKKSKKADSEELKRIRKQRIQEKEQQMLLERNRLKEQEMKVERDLKAERDKKADYERQMQADQVRKAAIQRQNELQRQQLQQSPQQGSMSREQYEMLMQQQSYRQMQYLQHMAAQEQQRQTLAAFAAYQAKAGVGGVPDEAGGAAKLAEAKKAEHAMLLQLNQQYRQQHAQVQYMHGQQMLQLQMQQQQQLQQVFEPMQQLHLRQRHQAEVSALAAQHEMQMAQFESEAQQRMNNMVSAQQKLSEEQTQKEQKELLWRKQQEAMQQQELMRQQVLQQQMAQQQQMMAAQHMDPRQQQELLRRHYFLQQQQLMAGQSQQAAGFGAQFPHANGGEAATPGGFNPQASAAGLPRSYGETTKRKKLVVCEYEGCNKSYTQRHNLLTHMRKKHGYRADQPGASSRGATSIK